MTKDDEEYKKSFLDSLLFGKGIISTEVTFHTNKGDITVKHIPYEETLKDKDNQ